MSELLNYLSIYLFKCISYYYNKEIFSRLELKITTYP